MEPNVSGACDPSAAPGRDAGGAQAQVDWAEFPGAVLGDEVVDLVTLIMTLSCNRKRRLA